jgi:AraC family transcriptional regulator
VTVASVDQNLEGVFLPLPGISKEASSATWSPPLIASLADEDAAFSKIFETLRPKAVSTVALKASGIAISRISASEPGLGFTSALPVENAYLVAVQLEDTIGGELWKGRQMISTPPFLAGSLIISHLREEPRFNFQGPFDILLLHIPELAFYELAAQHGGPVISGLRSEYSVKDMVLHNLARTILSTLESPLLTEGSFLAQLTLAMCFRLAQHYGSQSIGTLPKAGTLSTSQLKMAQSLLAADLTEPPPLDKVARSCGMSISRFARAFRATTGLPPHRWLRAFRVERSKELLLSTATSLAQIAYDCGFADQAHFTRVFSAATNLTPASWRRARRS